MTLSRIPRRWIAISIAAALALIAAAAPRMAQAQRTGARFGSDYRSRIDTTFAFDKTGSVNVSAGNGDITITYTGKLSGDTIAFTIEMAGGNNNAQPSKFEAKRSK